MAFYWAKWTHLGRVWFFFFVLGSDAGIGFPRPSFFVFCDVPPLTLSAYERPCIELQSVAFFVEK